MRRKDREITDKSLIDGIIDRCPVLRVGMYDKEAARPYVLPVSFGWERIEDEWCFYFHCAKVGYKLELIERDSRVCVELDRFAGYGGTGSDSTTWYESCIGFGEAALVSGDEARHGLELLMAHCEREGQEFSSCLDHTAVVCLRVRELSGKSNLSDKPRA